MRFRIVRKPSALLRVPIALSQNAQLAWQARMERLPGVFFTGKLGRMATITENICKRQASLYWNSDSVSSFASTRKLSIDHKYCHICRKRCEDLEWPITCCKPGPGREQSCRRCNDCQSMHVIVDEIEPPDGAERHSKTNKKD